jgi:hypothetical protein
MSLDGQHRNYLELVTKQPAEAQSLLKILALVFDEPHSSLGPSSLLVAIVETCPRI